MLPIAIFTLILVLLVLFESLKVVKENQRGVLFRIGRYEKVIGPGIFFILPAIDRLVKINLNDKLPGWQGLSKRELENKVKEIAIGER